MTDTLKLCMACVHEVIMSDDPSQIPTSITDLTVVDPEVICEGFICNEIATTLCEFAASRMCEKCTGPLQDEDERWCEQCAEAMDRMVKE